MCMEDVRLGRASSAAYYGATSNGAAGVLLCPGNERRICLVISSDGVGLVHVGPTNSGISATRGITLTAQNPVVKLTIEEVGSALFQEWRLFDNGVPGSCFAISTELDKV